MITHSEQIGELAAALAKAQGTMKSAPKDKVNPHFKSAYASLDSIIETAKDTLSKQGLSISQLMTADEGGVILVSMLLHSSGQWLKSCIPIKPERPTAQGIGACLTYMRRYSITGLLGISTDEDDDGNSANLQGNMTTSVATPQNKPAKISDKQHGLIKGLIKGDTDYEQKILDHYKIESMRDLPATQATLVIERVKAYQAEKLVPIEEPISPEQYAEMMS